MPPFTTTESTANGALQELPAQLKLQSTTTTATSATTSAAAAATTANQWWSLRTHPPPPTGTAATLCSLAWLLWAVAVIGGCALLFHLPPWQYAAFVTAAFALSAAIPDPGTAPWPTYAHLCLPIIAARGLRAGGAWTYSLIYWAFVLLPTLDAIVGVDTFNHARVVYATLAERRTFRVTTCVFPLVEVALLLWSFREVAARELTVAEAVGYSVSVGVYAGGFGILIAHELLHRNTEFERLLGRIIIALMCYGHFNVEHNHGHHRTVATPEDPATARYGESFWSFLPRCVVNSFRSAVTIENARLRAEGLPWHHNEVYRYGVVSATVAALVAALFGRAALYMFLGQSLMGIILFESVNYLEHYGLERREVSPGKYESVGVEHSWDSPFRLSNMCLFKLQRHADHHIAAGKRYQLLLAQKDAPQLPCGYPGSILLAFVPPAWFRVMNPRIHALRARHPGRVWRFGPPCAGDSAAGDSAAGDSAAAASVRKFKDM